MFKIMSSLSKILRYISENFDFMFIKLQSLSKISGFTDTILMSLCKESAIWE